MFDPLMIGTKIEYELATFFNGTTHCSCISDGVEDPSIWAEKGLGQGRPKVVSTERDEHSLERRAIYHLSPSSQSEVCDEQDAFLQANMLS